MAVLRRGERAESPRLEGKRRFPASFAWAWRFWLSRFGAFLRLMWLPCLISGAVCAAWWAVRSNFYFIGVEVREILIDIPFGAAVLYVWSMMRAIQADYLAAAVQDTEPGGLHFVRNFAKVARRAARPFLPLLAAWIIAYFLVYLPLNLGAGIYVLLPLAVVAVFIIPPIFGIIQTNLELNPDAPLLSGAKAGVALIPRRFVGTTSLWVIALLLIAVLAAVLLFGLMIIDFAIVNSQRATVQEEVISLPGWLPLVQSAVLTVCMAVISFAGALWSLPQQVHFTNN